MVNAFLKRGMSMIMNPLVTFGRARSFTATSVKDKWAAGLYKLYEKMVISPNLRKLKKLAQQVAHNMMVPGCGSSVFQLVSPS